MLEFFRKHYHPSSPSRAKLAIHLIAQSSAADLANKTSDAEKRDKLVEMMGQMLGQMGLSGAAASSADLSKRMQKVDLSRADVEGIVNAVGGYMKEGLGVAAEQVEQVLEQGKVALAQVLPSLGIVAQQNGEEKVNGEAAAPTANGNDVTDGGKTAHIIEDVKAFKASMPLSAGPRAVKDLREFEELGSKL